MDSEHDKLVARVQGFYDLLIKSDEENGINGILILDPETKARCSFLMEEYSRLTDLYEDMFKDFLYTGEHGKT